MFGTGPRNDEPRSRPSDAGSNGPGHSKGHQPTEDELLNLQKQGDWNRIIELCKPCLNASTDDPIDLSKKSLEIYIVALNKTRDYLGALEMTQDYIRRYAEKLPDIKLSEIDALDPSIRNTGLSAEVLAAAGKALRELSNPSVPLADKKRALEIFSVDADVSGDIDRRLMELSTKMYEHGFFLDRSHYSAINAAHNNKRLGNDARAERFAWMAAASFKDGKHAGTDYWETATRLEAAIISRDRERLPELLRKYLEKCADPETSEWMVASTLTTLRDTFGIQFESPDPELPSELRITFSILHQLEKGASPTSLVTIIEGLQLQSGSRPKTNLEKWQEELSCSILERTLDRDWRQGNNSFEGLYADAARTAPVFFEKLGLISRVTGTELQLPPTTESNPYGLKGRERARQRLEDFAGDTTQLTDILRASIACESLEQVYQVLQVITNDQDMEIVAIKDRFLEPLDTGYRDILLKIRIEGHVAELQLHLNSILEVKNGEGHRLYEDMRAIFTKANDEGRTLTEEEEKRVKKLSIKMRGLYDNAVQE
ncbi:MAG: hypothetical protein D6719_03940 [Candidatus Dadabacteria bacterium]|nr:MAG: hypothetical protein D6719_03940 [Candidatus Dadabacteria bacterium]